jgi:deazaflavin-dependent oxidoreductase (nitroreductase family)
MARIDSAAIIGRDDDQAHDDRPAERQGEDLVVVGSWGGSARDPAWAGNLRAEPLATVLRGGTRTAVRAEEVGSDDRDRVWAMVVERFPLYATYQQRTSREIPLFALRPAG